MATDGLYHAIRTISAAEIEYARDNIECGSTLTRVLHTFEDAEAIVQVFLTTTLKAPADVA